MMFSVMKKLKSRPATISITRLLYMECRIGRGLYTHNRGSFNLLYYYSWDNCIRELLPQPNTVPLLSSAKQWLPAAAIFFMLCNPVYMSSSIRL